MGELVHPHGNRDESLLKYFLKHISSNWGVTWVQLSVKPGEAHWMVSYLIATNLSLAAFATGI